MIELKAVSKIYKSKKGTKTLALDHISFTLPNKGLFFILGKSGSGKSTLLNILGGLDQYSSGEMIIDSKSTKRFKSKDFDYYRNTYVGFIFQEFNLLEEYNVYDNIIISRKLQKEKVNKNVVDDLLNKVGIGGLGNRKISELSGGQKGRVAIARALIKNPEIILADEPTGNLDEETGKKIFELLKAISKEKLVIVVSHDRDSALSYADGILEISDGKIFSNSVSQSSDENRNFKSKKSKLPFFSSLKFAFLNLKNHKIKLFFTILLVFMSITFFGTSKILSKFDIEKSHAKTMKQNKNEYITLKKGLYNDYDKSWYDSDNIFFKEEDIKEITKQLKSPYRLKYQLNENNEPVTLDIDYKGMMSSGNLTAYYLFIPSTLNFIETDQNFINQKTIGKYPENYDEIMIHSYFADFIMKYGIALYEENPNQFKKEYYKPASYEDFFAQDRYYKLGSTKVKITGIIMDDTESFQYLKEIPYQQLVGLEAGTWLGVPKEKGQGFTKIIVENGLDIYVAPGFGKKVGLKPNTVIDGNYCSVQVNNGTQKLYVGGNYRYLENKIMIFDGEKISTVNELRENEIIMPESYLDRLSKNEYTKLKEQYIKNNQEQIRNLELENKKIREENKKIMEEYEKKLELGEVLEEPVLKEEKEVIYKEEEELKIEFLKNYLKENSVTENNISLVFRLTESEKSEKTIKDLKIIGFEIDGSDVYMPNTIAKEFMKDNDQVSNIVIKEEAEKKIEQLLYTFPTENNKYMSITTYSDHINSIEVALDNIAWIAKYASYLFGFFAFILLTNFIVTSIYYNKKTIGILRGLGARKKDAFMIFLNEGFIIGVISLILSIITLNSAIYFTNQYISNHLFFDINFITFTKENFYLISGSVIAIIFVSSLFTVRRIAKMNPVDAILNK